MKVRFLIFFGALLLPLAMLHGADAVFDPCRFGAKPDGATLCTAAIQKAIEQCASAGGGTVRLPAGAWLTGTIFLRSHHGDIAVLATSPQGTTMRVTLPLARP